MSEILYGCLQPTIYANIPVFVDLFLDEEPEFKWVTHPLERGRTLIYAADGPIFRSFVHAPGSKDGFAGAYWEIKLWDDSIYEWKGGELWASGEAHAAHLLGIERFVGAGYHTPDPTWSSFKVDGYSMTGMACEVDLEFLLPFYDEGWLELGMGPYHARPLDQERSYDASADQERVIEA